MPAMAPRSAHVPLVRHRFERQIAPSPGGIDLFDCCLTIAEEEYPDLERGRYRRQMARLKEGARDAVDGAIGLKDALDRLNAFTFERSGFRGNEQEYYDPRNSFMNDVLDRRMGLPITLSILYMELADAASIDLVGIGLPGHFVVRSRTEPLFIDPFNQGSTMTEDDCRKIASRSLPDDFNEVDRFLQPVAPRQILARLLTNLKAIYLKKGEMGRALAALERIVLLLSDSDIDRRDLGLLYLRSGLLPPALRILSDYVDKHRGQTDADEIARHLQNVANTVSPPDRYLGSLRSRQSSS